MMGCGYCHTCRRFRALHCFVCFTCENTPLSADPADPMGNTDSCHIYSDDYLDCLKSNKTPLSKCSDYLHMLRDCQDRSDAASGPRSIKVAAAAPTNSSDPCHIHSKAYVVCLNNSKVPLGKCMDYVDMYNECCWRIDGAAGAKGDMKAEDSVSEVTVAAPITKADPCDIHYKAYVDCEDKSEMLRGKYRYHLKMFHECRRRVNAAAGPGMDKGESCDIHSKAFEESMKNHGVMQKKCKHYRNMLDECRGIDD